MRQLPQQPSSVIGSTALGSGTVFAAPGSAPAGTSSGAEPLNRILNALSNRGLLTQQNGKFYYVGGERATTTTFSSASSLSSATASVANISAVQAFKGLPSGEENVDLFCTCNSNVLHGTVQKYMANRHFFFKDTLRTGLGPGTVLFVNKTRPY